MSPAPAGPKADVCVLISVKEGTTVKEYLDLFWSHANSKTIKAKGKSYTLPAPRSGFCDEKKTRVFVNTKAKQLVVTSSGATPSSMPSWLAACPREVAWRVRQCDVLTQLSGMRPPWCAADGEL